jgi:two-component sensor histidine kinase/CHASE3 domain sensor protein
MGIDRGLGRMVATTTFQIGVKRRAIPIWLMDRKTASQFAGIVFLAILSFAVSAVVMSRTWDARDWVRHTSQVRLGIDQVIWHLLALQQTARLNPESESRERLLRLRDNVRNDLAELTRLTSGNAAQQQQIVELNTAFIRYFSHLEQIFTADGGSDTDRGLATAMAADVAQVSKQMAGLRFELDGLLRQRSARADTLLAFTLPTLSSSAGLIVFLVVFVARSINRTLAESKNALSEKDSELAAKDLMMREIDHRVRNSLNLVHSLMSFQMRRTADAAARALLTEAANQVLVVARVHERLYKYGSMEAVELGDYLRDLCTDVAAFSLPAEAQAAIQLHSGRAEVRAEEAIWLGLIVVELVTNAVKYGKPSLQSPILVDVSPDEKELRVVVSDSGAGLPTGFDLQSSKGLGMQVVLLLVRQLHATLEVDPAWVGTRFILTVPVAKGGQIKGGQMPRRTFGQTSQAA